MKMLRTVRNVAWAIVFIIVFVVVTTMLGWRVLDKHQHIKPSSAPETSLDHPATKS